MIATYHAKYGTEITEFQTDLQSKERYLLQSDSVFLHTLHKMDCRLEDVRLICILASSRRVKREAINRRLNMKLAFTCLALSPSDMSKKCVLI